MVDCSTHREQSFAQIIDCRALAHMLNFSQMLMSETQALSSSKPLLLNIQVTSPGVMVVRPVEDAELRKITHQVKA